MARKEKEKTEDAQAVDGVHVERIKVQVLPNGNVDTKNAARILNRKTQTLAQWRWRHKGPPWKRIGGRIQYDYAGVMNYED